jgi:ribosomal protein S18 acetylase RimI-like enzyme
VRVNVPLLVREATAADADVIGDVHAEAWRAAYRDLLEGAWLDHLVTRQRREWTSRISAGRTRRDTVLVAEREHKVAAFIHFGPHSEGLSEGEIFELSLHPTVGGRGVAPMLLDTAREMLAGAGLRQVRVWTLGGTNHVRRCYEALGFEETGRRREHDLGDRRPVLQLEYRRSTA